MTDDTSGPATASLPEHQFFCGVCVQIFKDHCLSFRSFSFRHCIVCPSSIRFLITPLVYPTFLDCICCIIIETTVEVRQLKFEVTVKMCSCHRRIKPPKFSNFGEKKIWYRPGTVSLHYDKLMPSTMVLSRKKDLILKKFTFLRNVFSVFMIKIGNTRSGINSWINIGIMCDNSDIYF